ncbi:MAG: lipocalin family protein [Phycisphaerae bacterium]
MKHAFTATWPVVGLVAVTGCSRLVGTWDAVAWTPDDTTACPIVHVTFGDDDRFTATTSADARPHTSTGRYTWNGRKLVVSPDGGETRTYTARLRLDGKLELSHAQDGRIATALLEKTDD